MTSWLYKVGKLHLTLNSNSGKCIALRELSIDEQMIGTKSRISFIQYMPKKPKKFGIKIWALCEALTGYCLQYQIYTGAEEGTTEKGLTSRVVLDLMKQYEEKNHHLYFDNFYTSLSLMLDLSKKNIYACGTLRTNRAKLPKEFIHKDLSVGESSYLATSDVLAVHWKDKRDVFALSTIHDSGERVINRYKGDVTKPEMICQYNIFMGGVDKCDQFLSYYAFGRKTSK